MYSTMASNGPQRARIQNFEKQKQKCPKEYCAKKWCSHVKNWYHRACRGPMSHGLFLSWIREHTRGRSRSRPKQKQTLAQSAIKDHFQRFQQYFYFFPMYAYKDRTYKMYFLALKRLFEFCSDIDLDSTSSSTWIYRTIVGIFSLNIDSKN